MSIKFKTLVFIEGRKWLFGREKQHCFSSLPPLGRVWEKRTFRRAASRYHESRCRARRSTTCWKNKAFMRTTLSCKIVLLQSASFLSIRTALMGFFFCNRINNFFTSSPKSSRKKIKSWLHHYGLKNCTEQSRTAHWCRGNIRQQDLGVKRLVFLFGYSLCSFPWPGPAPTLALGVTGIIACRMDFSQLWPTSRPTPDAARTGLWCRVPLSSPT